MNTITGVLLTIVVIGGIWVIRVNNQQPITTSVQRDSGLTNIERQSFMRYCNEDGTMEGYCQCTLDHLEENNSATKIRQMNNEVTNDYMPPEMWEAVDACLNRIDERDI
jgi:hypothetical protein